MIPWLTEHFGNPASRSHAYWLGAGRRSKSTQARGRTGQCDAKGDCVWTSGATEVDQPGALKGRRPVLRERGKHLITVKTEHKATLDTMRELERQGFG